MESSIIEPMIITQLYPKTRIIQYSRGLSEDMVWRKEAGELEDGLRLGCRIKFEAYQNIRLVSDYLMWCILHARLDFSACG
jgi:hypothetical protein